jgi:hypothetical protein
MLFGCEPIGQLLSGRTAIDILFRHIDKVLLAKATLRFRARRHGLGQCHGDAGFDAFQDLRTVEVSAIAATDLGRRLERNRKFADSPLEGEGFETLVLRHKTRGFPEHPGIASPLEGDGFETLVLRHKTRGFPKHPGIAGVSKSPAGPDWRRIPRNRTAPLVMKLKARKPSITSRLITPKEVLIADRKNGSNRSRENAS